MPRPTPIGLRHEILALAREGMPQGDIAGRVGVRRETVNRILHRHATTGSLEPGKSTGAPRKKTRLAKTGHCSEWCEKIALDLHDLSMRG